MVYRFKPIESPLQQLSKFIFYQKKQYIWIKDNSKSSPHFTIEVKSDTEVIFKFHKKAQFNQ